MEKRQTLAIVSIVIMILSTLGYALLSAPFSPQETPPPNFYYTIPGVDFSDLKPEQFSEALQILNTEQCLCGDGIETIAACRNLYPTDTYSLQRAQEIVNKFLEVNRRIEGNISSSADTDGDGVTDGDENRLGLNPAKKDTDGDGIPDGMELRIGTNPLKVESVSDIEKMKKELADARLEGNVSSEEFSKKLSEYKGLIALLENRTSTGIS